MLPPALSVERPGTLREALQCLAEAAPCPKVLAGGTDLLVKIRNGLDPGGMLLDISSLNHDLNYIDWDGSVLRIGALTTHDEISRSEPVRRQVPVLAQSCRMVGSPQIRNRGTLAGNIVNASPAGDSLPALLAVDAAVKLSKKGASREIKLIDFLVGPGRTLLAGDELLTEIIIPAGPGVSRGVYHKMGSRNALTIAVASVAVVTGVSGDVHIAYGALASKAIRALALEQAIKEKGLSDWNRLSNIIRSTVQPISDQRASAGYRREMAVNLTYMALAALQSYLPVPGPATGAGKG